MDDDDNEEGLSAGAAVTCEPPTLNEGDASIVEKIQELVKAVKRHDGFDHFTGAGWTVVIKVPPPLLYLARASRARLASLIGFGHSVDSLEML